MTLDELRRRVVARWPSLSPGDDDLARVLEESAGLELDQAEDRYLAHACACQRPDALRIFEAEVMQAVHRALRRVDPSNQFVDECASRVRERLLVGTPLRDGRTRPPGLLAYLGQGPLTSFAMVIAMREAVENKRRPLLEVALDELLVDAPATGARADSQLAREALRPALKAAVDAALAELTPRQRTVFKLHVLNGLSAQRLAVMYGVHRATTTRWISEARAQLAEGVARRVQGPLRIGEESFASVRRMLLSGIDLTVSACVE